MPTQAEVEYLKHKHQKFTMEKLKWSLLIGSLTNVITAPAELIKVRSQLLGEGKSVHGYANERGNPAVRMVYEIYDSGAGTKGLFSGWDAQFAKGLYQSAIKTFLWCHIYNYYNDDPRRVRSLGVSTFTNFLAGFGAGLLTNPIDLVYNRIVADPLFPKENRRNYSSFINGLIRANNEGVLFRGALASGLSYGLMLASLSNLYDYLKEYLFYFFGPTDWLRPTVLLPVTFVGAYIYLPFDNIRTRLHIMTPLPDGRYPYLGLVDAFKKICLYEADPKKYSSLHVFHNGFISFYVRLYVSLFIGIKLSDIAFSQKYKEGEFIELGSYYTSPYLKQIPHSPYNRSEVNKQILDIKPTEEFYVDESKTGSFKI